ncbi:PAS domain S-box protein, partial [Candidatus Poribacteria bacterium]|nr:PAS domain S-box protein [Candidatus Poribacteria bacterium]
MDRDDIARKENQVKEKIVLKDRIDELEKLASDRKRAHKLLKIQYELGQSLYSDLDFDEILELCFEAALEASGMDCGGLYIIDEKTGDLDLAYHKGLNPDFIEKNSHFDADSPNAKLIKQGEPLYTLHKELRKELERPELKEKIKAIAVIPIKYEGKVIACLNIASHTLEEFTDSSKAALEAIAAQVGLLIIKSKMTQNIMESGAHFRMLIENSSDIITIMNPDGTITYESPSVEKILGYRPDELVGKNSIDFIHPDDAGIIAENLMKAMEEKGDNKTLTFRFLHKNGNWRILEGIGKSVFNKGQIQIITNCRDITERKQAETSLRESEDRFKIFLDSIKDV